MRTTALPAAEATRPRTVVVGALLATGAVFMAFAALVAVYVQQRQSAQAAGQEWFPEGSVELGPAGMMMMTLVLSMVTVQWAVQAARTEDRPHGFIALGVTLMFGAAVINQFWFVYQDTALRHRRRAGRAAVLRSDGLVHCHAHRRDGHAGRHHHPLADGTFRPGAGPRSAGCGRLLAHVGVVLLPDLVRRLHNEVVGAEAERMEASS